MKTCYYALLEVAPTAPADDIKRAYRRLALVHHPDKNPDRADDATLYFAQLQVAYDVLSDPHERAWYDSHKEQILREPTDPVSLSRADRPMDADGDDYGVGWSTSRGHSEDSLMRYFSSDCYRGYGDDAQGFFTVYRALFDALAKEELAAHEQDTDAGRPSAQARYVYTQVHFGTSTTRFTDVSGTDLREFYANWMGFTTVRSFRWLDKWRLRDAQNRWEKRQMEKQNRAAREAGRRGFNDAVRALAAFVRKRDLRYKAYMAEVQREKMERADVVKARESARKAAARATVEAAGPAEWTQVLIPGLQELEEEWLAEELADREIWECAACDKSFRSEGAFANHELSAKHRKAVRALRRALLKEEGVAVSAEEEEESEEEEEEVSDESNSVKEQLDPVLSKKQRKARQRPKPRFGHDVDVDRLAEHLDGVLGADSSSAVPPVRLDSSDEDWKQSGKRGGGRQRGKPRGKGRDSPGTSSPMPKAKAVDTKASDAVPVQVQLAQENGWSGEDEEYRRQRRGKPNKHVEAEYVCNTCRSAFASRNQLFAHIKSSGHALHVVENKKKKPAKR